MTFAQVKKHFEDKSDVECNVTDELVTGGYRQKKGGYIKIARERGVINPSQWWHLMNYCQMKEENHEENKSYRYTPCGELVFWMAEVSGAVTESELKTLKDRILCSEEVGNRRKWNKEIKGLCWEEICRKIEATNP